MKPLDKKAKEHVNNLTPLLDVSFMDKEECVNYQAELSYKAGYLEGRQDALRECLEIIKSVRSRYPIDIFPQFKDATEENVSVDRISAQMARHLCNKLLIDFQTLMQQESGNE